MSTLLKIEQLEKSYGKTSILKGIHLDVQEGEIISVLGPSGCGKSTLLRIISGITGLDNGTVSIKDKVVSSKKVNIPTEKRDINMVFQDFALWPHMDVYHNITFGLKIQKQTEQEIKEALTEVVELLHLEGLIKRYPSELSGGQQQRVAIARALITRPTIILLDEPLCNLDIQLRVEMRTEMAYLFKKLKTTVFHVTHDPTEAFAMADRIIIMNAGEIDQMDSPENCYNFPKTVTVAGLLGAGNSLKQYRLSNIQEEYASFTLGTDTLVAKCFLKDTSASVACDLRFRPEDCHFSKTKQENSIAVTIVLSTFEGSYYRIKCETKEKEQFSFLHTSSLEQNESGYITFKKELLYAYNQG